MNLFLETMYFLHKTYNFQHKIFSIEIDFHQILTCKLCELEFQENEKLVLLVDGFGYTVVVSL